MKELAVGQVRKGVVKNITDFGAFIDLGGVDGLLHITDMSYGRVSHPTEMVADRQGSRGQDPRHRLAARAHQPGHEAAPVLPLAERGRQVPGRHAGPGQGRLDHQLRRVRRDRAGHRGPGPHLRDELDPERAPPVQDREHRRDHRGRGAQGGRGGGEDLARHEADRAGSVDGAAAQVPGGHPHPGQGPEPHQLRRLRRDRAGHRRPDPHLRHVLDQAGPAPVRGGQEGRRGGRRDPQHRRREQADLASGSSRPRRIPGSGSARPIRSASSSAAAPSA